ncbi:hypothetical protein BGX26_008532 [Mortierella sp. AD094]|nr:hypothetical protein BGX26_008532 [Mortierella sp. AD094]
MLSVSTVIPISPPVLQHMTHLTQHIATHGLEHGVGSDISIVVFGKTYRLHRLILTQSKFFEGMLQGPWREREMNLVEMKIDDKNITLEGFDIVIKRLYGIWTDDQERVQRGGNTNKTNPTPISLENVLSVLASGAYLGMDGLCEQCTTFVIRTISATCVSKYVRFCDKSSYYPWSDRIAEACHTYLCRNAFDEPRIKCLRVFETLPCQWLFRILKSDAFWVPNEWERYKYCRNAVHSRRRKRALEMLSGSRRAASTSGREGFLDDSDDDEYDNDENEDVYDILFSTCIRYMHMSFEQLEAILNDRDPITGESFTRPEIVHEALWQQTELRTIIDYCSKKDGSLDITVAGSSDNLQQKDGTVELQLGDDYNWWHETIPAQDRTFLGDICSPTQRLSAEEEPRYDEGILATPRHSMYSPFRFSVEFEGINLMQDNVRVCSDVVFYGGSYWNVYIQKLPSPEGLKLGVYLRRHSQPKISRPSKRPSLTSFASRRHGTPSSLAQRPSSLPFNVWNSWSSTRSRNSSEVEQRDRRVNGLVSAHSSTIYPLAISRSTSKLGFGKQFNLQATAQERAWSHDREVGSGFEDIGSSITEQDQLTKLEQSKQAEGDAGFTQILDLPNIDEGSLAPIDESVSCYIDKRDKSKTWFKIFAASIGPLHTITQFQSRPDDFSVMQSWGWCSSSLCSDDYLPKVTPGAENESETKFQTACPGPCPITTRSMPRSGNQVTDAQNIDELVRDLGNFSQQPSQQNHDLVQQSLEVPISDLHLSNNDNTLHSLSASSFDSSVQKDQKNADGSVDTSGDGEDDNNRSSHRHMKFSKDIKLRQEDTSEVQSMGTAGDPGCQCVAQQVFGHQHHHHSLMPSALKISIVMGHI